MLDALISSIDDQYEDIAMESMNGLSKVFEIVEVERVAPILVNICHRIRPAFEKRHNAIRAASFQVEKLLFADSSSCSETSGALGLALEPTLSTSKSTRICPR